MLTNPTLQNEELRKQQQKKYKLNMILLKDNYFVFCQNNWYKTLLFKHICWTWSRPKTDVFLTEYFIETKNRQAFAPRKGQDDFPLKAIQSIIQNLKGKAFHQVYAVYVGPSSFHFQFLHHFVPHSSVRWLADSRWQQSSGKDFQ